MYAHGSRGERPAFSLCFYYVYVEDASAVQNSTTEGLQVSFVQKILDKKF
jgi:hypothetical protein